MADELEPHFAAHRGLTKNGLDIEQTDTAHFQQVLQQRRTAALDGVLRHAQQVHAIVSHQAVTPRYEIQPQLALAQAGLASDEHAQTENVHEHAVLGDAVGEVLGQIGAQHVDGEGGRLRGAKQRHLRRVAFVDQTGRWLFAVGQHQRRRLQSDDAAYAPQTVFLVGVVEVINLAPAQDLYAKGVDVIQIPHQICAGSRPLDGGHVEATLGVALPGDPLPHELRGIGLEQAFGGEGGSFQIRRGRSWRLCRTSGAGGSALLHP